MGLIDTLRNAQEAAPYRPQTPWEIPPTTDPYSPNYVLTPKFLEMAEEHFGPVLAAGQRRLEEDVDPHYNLHTWEGHVRGVDRRTLQLLNLSGNAEWMPFGRLAALGHDLGYIGGEADHEFRSVHSLTKIIPQLVEDKRKLDHVVRAMQFHNGDGIETFYPEFWSWPRSKQIEWLRFLGNPATWALSLADKLDHGRHRVNPKVQTIETMENRPDSEVNLLFNTVASGVVKGRFHITMRLNTHFTDDEAATFPELVTTTSEGWRYRGTSRTTNTETGHISIENCLKLFDEVNGARFAKLVVPAACLFPGARGLRVEVVDHDYKIKGNIEYN